MVPVSASNYESGAILCDFNGEPAGSSGPANGEERGVRGGSFLDEAKRIRSANRESQTPGTDLATIGFRLVRTIP